ncbi:MAG TPA: PspC domain-containing protein [Myxococcota bacterium]|jgi:phage shock protein C|nr:PspC domain-containing protein [Myxococcota bacterium]
MNDLNRLDETSSRPPRSEWHRDPHDRKIAGVCAGLADALGVSVTAVRAGFVVLALPPFSGIGIVAYLALWFVMPVEDAPSGLDRLVGTVSRWSADPPRRPGARSERARFDADDAY